MRFVRKFLACCFLFATQVCWSQQSLQGGIITDLGNQEFIAPLIRDIKEEIQRTIGSTYILEFTDSSILTGIITPTDSKRAYEELLNKEVDFIIILGPKSLSGINEKTQFQTPTIAVGILDSRLQMLPQTASGSTGIENFTYIQSSAPLRESINRFKELVNFQNLSIVAELDIIQLFDRNLASSELERTAETLGITINTVPFLSESVEKMVIPDSTEAVLLLTDFQISPDYLSIIVDKLNEQKLPSFSITQEHVNQGVMLSYGDDRTQILRKLALTVDELLEGRSMAAMSVNIDLNQQLYVNISTAQLIQFPINYQTIFSANIIQEDNHIPQYKLTDILEGALNENLAIKISQRAIQNSSLDVRQAISNYYPDLDLSVSYTELSKNQANEFAFQSQRSASSSLSLSQVIFSENILANIKINEYLLEAQEYNTQQDVLDVIFDAYSAYLNILQSQASLEIQQENLAVSKTNLELAKLQYNLGASDNSDVYRFEGELATNTQQIIEAQANVLMTKMTLNQLLNYTLPDEFELTAASVESELFQRYINHPITRVIGSPNLIKKTVDYLVNEAKQQNPSKGELLANDRLLQRQLLLNQRQFYLPTVSANGSLSSTFLRGGSASIPSEGVEFADNTWNLGLSLNYPLYDGNRRKLDQQQTQISLDQNRLSIENFDQNIRLAIQNNMLSLFTAYTDLDYSKQSQDNQQKNFELNQNKYRVGQISIVQLLDAQNALIQAKQTYALSIYNFIQTFLQLEYNIGYFSQLSPPAKVQDFETRLQQFLNQ